MSSDSRTPLPAAFTESATPNPPAFDPLDYLSRAERETLLALRRVDFFRAGRARDAGVHWSGVRVRVGVEEQAGYG